MATRSGDFEFVNGYPTDDTANRLRDLQVLNRATEVFLTQLMPVSEMALRQGLRAFGASKPTQVVVWEQLMDAKTVLLTANTETVYAISHLALKDDGPTVIEAPPHMLGFIQDGLQRYLADIGPLGSDKGAGGKFLVLPPGFDGDVPDGYFVVRSPTYSVTFAVRGFQVDGSTDPAVAVDEADPRLSAGGCGLAADDGVPQRVRPRHRHPVPRRLRVLRAAGDDRGRGAAEVFGPLERWLMQAIGIEKGTPFDPDDDTKAVLDEAARLGGAMARVNTYASSAPDVYFYPDRKWQGALAGVSYTFLKDGVPQIDARNNVYYMAAGNSPAMMEKNVGQGSQYLWTYRDADGNYLDGAKNYRLHVPPDIPIKNFWSVVVYDALSRSELQNGQPFPSVSGYTDPAINADGSVDIAFGPEQPADTQNWIATVPGRGWFPIFRFYSPTEAYFDKTWKLAGHHPDMTR